MADEVARLDFASNIATVTAEVTGALQQLQTQLEAAGSRAGTKSQVGAQFTDGLQKIIGTVTEMGGVIQQQVTKSLEGLGKLSDFKGPTTLGGQFTGLITQLQEASAAYAKALDPTASRQLGGQANVQAQTRQQLVAPIQALINQLREVQQIVNQRIVAMGAEQRAAFERFANPTQVGRAVGIGVAAGAVDSAGGTVGGGIVAATDATIKARQREATAAAAAAQADEEYAQELRNLKVYLDEEITAGRARRFANDNVNVDTAAGRVQYRYPSQLDQGELPATAGTEGAAQQADVRRAEEAAYQAQERFLAQQEKDSLSLTRQQQGVNRAHQQAIDTEATWADQALQGARFAAYQSGTEGYGRLGAKSPFFATPEGPSKITGFGLDTGLNTKEMDAAAAAYAKSTIRGTEAMDEAFASFQQVKTANEGLARSDTLYSSLLEKEGLVGIAGKNPGDRLLSGGYAQLDSTLLRQSASGLQVVQGNEEVYRASQALASRLVQEARLTQGGTSGGAAVDPRRGSVFDSFLGGAFGHGFDTSQAFDPSLALGNLAATAGVLARYGYEFKLIQGVLGSIKTSFTDLGAYQQAMVGLDEAVAATGADSLDLGSAFSTAATEALNQNEAITIGTQGLQAYRDELAQGTSANTIFERSITAVGNAVILSGQDAATAQRNLIAATNSFQLGSGGQSRINDAVLLATRNYGGTTPDIYDALSTAGGAAQEAGLTPEQLANIVALIRSRTGDTGSTIASSINRLVSRQENQQFRGALDALGVQQTGQLLPEIIALSKAYQGLTVPQQQSLILSLGGARALKDLLPLLQDGTSLLEKNKESQNGAGAAAAEAARQLGTLSGQLKELRALFTDILTNFGRAGLFGGFGYALAVIKPALEGVNELLSTFDSAIPGLGTGILGIVIDFALLGKTIQVFQAKMEAKSATDLQNVETTTASTQATVENTAAVEQSIAVRDSAIASSDAQAVALNAESAAVANQTRLLLERNAVLLEGGVAGGAGAAGFWDQPAVAGVEGGLLARGRGAIGGLAGRGGLVGATATGVGSTLGLLSNPLTLAILGFVAIGGMSTHAAAWNHAADQATAALSDLGKAKTAEDYQTVANNLKAASAAQHKAGGGFWAFLAGDENPDTSFLDSEARFAASTAKRLGTQSPDVSELTATTFGITGHDVAAGLAAMKTQGVDAGVQLKAVAQALGLVNNAADSAAGSLVAGIQAPTGLRFSDALATGLASNWQNLQFAGSGAYSVAPGSQNNVDFTAPGSAALRKTILASTGKNFGDILTDGDKQEIATAVANSWGLSGPASEVKKARAAIRAAVLAQLQTYTAKSINDQTGLLSDQDLADLLPNLSNIVNAKGDPRKIGSDAAILGQGPESALAVLKGVAARAPDKQGVAFQALLTLIHDVENSYVTARIADLEKLRAAAEADAGNNTGQIKHIRADFFAQEITAAHNNENVLASILSNMTQSEINLVLAKYHEQLQLARQAAADEEALLNSIDSLPNIDTLEGQKRAANQSKAVIAAHAKDKQIKDTIDSLNTAAANSVPQTSISSDSAISAAQQSHLAEINAGADPRNPLQQAQVALQAAKYQLSIATKGTADYWNALKAVKDAEYALAQAHVQIADAIAQSQVFPGSKIQAAAAELTVAANELRVAEQGTADWYKAQADEVKARLDYAAAVHENRHVLRELHGDTTDPLFQAKEALRQAKGQLTIDKRNNAPSDVLNADREKVQEAGYAKQRAAFDQKFADEKTAFDLQQISSETYLRFLEHQRAVLQNIHHKTRQQIDELNQVDEAIKGMADQLNGQFNIGDIKIPTPYEARRYIQATSQGQGYQSTAVTNNATTVNISGADPHKVKQILKQLLGSSSIGRTSTGTRKS